VICNIEVPFKGRFDCKSFRKITEVLKKQNKDRTIVVYNCDLYIKAGAALAPKK
jgi:hypothetical protein